MSRTLNFIIRIKKKKKIDLIVKVSATYCIFIQKLWLKNLYFYAFSMIHRWILLFLLCKSIMRYVLTLRKYKLLTIFDEFHRSLKIFFSKSGFHYFNFGNTIVTRILKYLCRKVWLISRQILCMRCAWLIFHCTYKVIF